MLDSNVMLIETIVELYILFFVFGFVVARSLPQHQCDWPAGSWIKLFIVGLIFSIAGGLALMLCA